MILTGKAKEDFLNYYWSNYIGKTRFFNQKSETEDFFNSLYKTLKNALIIEWFDSMEYKGKRMYSDIFSFYYVRKIQSQSFNDICIQTIERCNEFYNELEPHQLPD